MDNVNTLLWISISCTCMYSIVNFSTLFIKKKSVIEVMDIIRWTLLITGCCMFLVMAGFVLWHELGTNLARTCALTGVAEGATVDGEVMGFSKSPCLFCVRFFVHII